MTVADLMVRLAQFPHNMPVAILDNDTGDFLLDIVVSEKPCRTLDVRIPPTPFIVLDGSYS